MASPSKQLDLPVVRDADPTGDPASDQRIIKDVASMSAAELLIVVLGPNHAEASAVLARRYPSFRALAAAHPLDWRETDLSRAGVERLSAIFEIAKRYGETAWVTGAVFSGSYDVYAHFRERLATETVEFFIAVLLDNKHRKIRDVVVGQGSLTASIVHPRDVFSRVIRDSAAAVVFVHNHPSGDATPSAEDLEITTRLRQVGELVGVRVLDHIIIGKGGFVSFVDDGYW